MIRFYKPQKEAYQAGIEALGLEATDVLFVAGSSGDVVGAAAAGMKVVWNNHIGLEPKTGANPLREGKSLDEALVDFL
jgi:2-haloacid dehalogenase